MAECQDYPPQPRRPQESAHDSGDNTTTESISLKEFPPSRQEKNNTVSVLLSRNTVKKVELNDQL